MTSVEETIGQTAGRREFLLRLGSAGLGVAAGTILAGCGGGSNSGASAQGVTGDAQIIQAAATAEALATTMYYHIINSSLYTSLASNTPDQLYLVAAYQQEIDHYNALIGTGVTPLATTFYFPTNMFTDNQTTLNTLNQLEDVFIAAYLYGIMAFSNTAYKVLAGQILGVEAEHRALGRVIANDVGLSSTTNYNGSTEPVGPTNNLAYERTYGIASLSTVTSALGPFVTSGTSGFSTTAFPLSAAATVGSNGQLTPSYPNGSSAVTLSNNTPSS